jgi:hypothetical protein
MEQGGHTKTNTGCILAENDLSMAALSNLCNNPNKLKKNIYIYIMSKESFLELCE